MGLESKAINMEVIGKRERTKGLIFKRPEYLVALQVVDETVTASPTLQRELSFHQYSTMNVGDNVNITMYTKNGRNWYFSREEAELFSK